MVAAISTEGFSEIFGGVQRRIGLDVLVCFFCFSSRSLPPKAKSHGFHHPNFTKFLVACWILWVFMWFYWKFSTFSVWDLSLPSFGETEGTPHNLKDDMFDVLFVQKLFLWMCFSFRWVFVIFVTDSNQNGKSPWISSPFGKRFLGQFFQAPKVNQATKFLTHATYLK